MPSRTLLVLLIAASIGCQPTTTRPSFTPFPEAAASEIRLSRPEATRRLADALRADSIPVVEVQQRDGYLASAWFESATGRPIRGRRLGSEVVKVRAWINPARPYASLMVVETVYRPLADPSRPDRDLERPVPLDHPTATKIRTIIEAMVKEYGGPS